MTGLLYALAPAPVIAGAVWLVGKVLQAQVRRHRNVQWKEMK